MIPLARKTLLHEWRRFLPAALAIGFSGLLQLVQAGLVLGIFSGAASYVSDSTADIWLGYPGTQSVDMGRPIDASLETRLLMDPEVTRVEPFVLVDGDWRASGSGGVSIYVSGIDPGAGGLMFARVVSPELRSRLGRPGAVIVDRADMGKLGVALGDHATINGQRVVVVGITAGLRALGATNVIASLDTARALAGSTGDAGKPTWLVASVRNPANSAAVEARLGDLRGFGPGAAWTADRLARESVLYWLLDTGAGVGVLFLAAVVFLVGALITSQTLSAATAGSIREYATLNALGVGIGALRRVVLQQVIWIGMAGLVGAMSLGVLLLVLAKSQDIPVSMTPAVMGACAGLTLAITAVSGLIAVRIVHRADPAELLR
jgi:putative ABC transport system permease protein